jgi:hypothetical protein
MTHPLFLFKNLSNNNLMTRKMNKIQSLKNAQEFQDLFGIQEHAKLSFSPQRYPAVSFSLFKLHE